MCLFIQIDNKGLMIYPASGNGNRFFIDVNLLHIKNPRDTISFLVLRDDLLDIFQDPDIAFSKIYLLEDIGLVVVIYNNDGTRTSHFLKEAR